MTDILMFEEDDRTLPFAIADSRISIGRALGHICMEGAETLATYDHLTGAPPERGASGTWPSRTKSTSPPPSRRCYCSTCW